MEGLIGKKIGMTQIWDADGVRVPVTVIEAGPCPVVQVKTTEKDGYEAVQLGWGPQKASRLSKAEVAHCAKAGLETPVRVLREFKADAGEEVKAGDVYTVSVFENIGYVDVIGTSKGHGFQGVMKRWNFQGGPMTHGSHTKRRPGSIGMRQDPGSVEKGHPMPGHMGARRVTTQNLKVVQVRPEQNIILVKGAIPGPNGGMVIVRKSIKKAVKA
ncbi:MAG: 50S ribosomal protein L3 [Kiritimatiellae bacterium]|nr:50S ribosomal protein L3 [Kiritimatiellia bacterium]